MSLSGGSADFSRLNLLLFSAGGIRFGVDLEQIDAMTEPAEETACDLHWFHNAVGFGDSAVQYQLPTVLSIKTANNQPYRVVIDRMEDIYECAVNAIGPLPSLLEPYLLKRGIWGVLQISSQIILLVDFQRIADNQLSNISHALKERSL